MSVNKNGLTEQKPFDAKAPIRKETGEATQRPEGQTKSVNTDRGTFKDKC